MINIPTQMHKLHFYCIHMPFFSWRSHHDSQQHDVGFYGLMLALILQIQGFTEAPKPWYSN